MDTSTNLATQRARQLLQKFLAIALKRASSLRGERYKASCFSLSQASRLSPICPLYNAGKALEHCDLRRLQKAITLAGDISPLQVGFKEGRSTIYAISLVKRIAAKATERTKWDDGIQEFLQQGLVRLKLGGNH